MSDSESKNRLNHWPALPLAVCRLMGLSVQENFKLRVTHSIGQSIMFELAE